MDLPVYCFTESGDGIGWGHLMRVSVLATALRQHGLECQVFLDHHGTRPGELPGDVSHVRWRDRLATFGDREPFVAVIDSYLATREQIASLAKASAMSVALDDYDRLDYPVDLVLNPNPFFNKPNEPARQRVDDIAVPADPPPVLAGGREWVLIREEIRRGTAEFHVRPEPETVTLTVGGSDHHQMLPRLVSQVRDSFRHINVIAGSQPLAEVLAARWSDDPVRVFGLVDAAEMRKRFTDSDVVVSGCGQTLHELACLGVPTIGFCVGEDQLPNQQYYLEHRFLGARLDWREETWPQILDQEIRQLQSAAERNRRSEVGRTLVDGGGARRLVELLISMLQERSAIGNHRAITGFSPERRL